MCYMPENNSCSPTFQSNDPLAHFVGCLMILTGTKHTYMYARILMLKKKGDLSWREKKRESDLSKGVEIEIQSGL